MVWFLRSADTGRDEMKMLLAATAITLATGSAAMAFDADIQAIIDSHKAGKPVAVHDHRHK